MSDILFGQAYFLRFDSKLWQAMQPYPPLGTLYAASYLRARGHSVSLFDAMLADSEQDWEHVLSKEQPRFAVLFEDNFNYLSKMCLLRMRQAAFKMISMARAQDTIIIVGGADASDHPELYLDQGADYVLIGEGEVTLAELIEALTGRNSQPVDSILGLAYIPERLAEKQAVDLASSATSLTPRVHTSRRPDIKVPDALPFPAWDLVDVARYERIWRQQHGYFSMNIVTTRGCPFHCNWCAKPIWGQRYNLRSPENVVAEMKWLKATYQPDHLWFMDDILGLKPGWLPRFAELIDEHKAHIPFKCLSRVDLLLRPGEIESLRQAGCQSVWVGAESGSQKILDAMEKGTCVEHILEASRRLKSASIQVGFFLQFGYPGETRADIQKTIQLLRDGNPDDIGISVSYPLPGTPFYERVKQQLGDKQNWDESNDLAMLYQGPFSTVFYRQLYRVIHKEFRARKFWQGLGERLSTRTSTPAPGSLGSNQGPRPTPLAHPGQRRPWMPELKSLFSAAYYTLSLPFDRVRLELLARTSHQGSEQLPQGLSPEAAAQPTPHID